jgi:hypothetical protein
MNNNIVEFPITDQPEHQWTESEVDKIHAQAFRDLEMSLRDAVRMSEIAAELMLRARMIDDKGLNFAVMHVCTMLMKLEEEYDARWHGEKQDQDMPARVQTARILRKFHALKPSYQKIILDWIETAAAEDNASA